MEYLLSKLFILSAEFTLDIIVIWEILRNKQNDRKVLPSSFHLNGHTYGFHPQTQKVEPLVPHHKQYHREELLDRFYLNGPRISSTNSKVIEPSFTA